MYADGRPSLVLVVEAERAPRALEGFPVMNGRRPMRVRHRVSSKLHHLLPPAAKQNLEVGVCFIFFYFFHDLFLNLSVKNRVKAGTNCTCVVASCDNRHGRVPSEALHY